MMTAARITTATRIGAISERKLDKLKQKVERLGKFLRIRILHGSPEEEVGVWSDKEGEIQGQIRQHSRLINILGVRQTRIGVNRVRRCRLQASQEL